MTKDERHDAAFISMITETEGFGYAVMEGYISPEDLRTEKATEAVETALEGLEELRAMSSELSREETIEAAKEFDF